MAGANLEMALWIASQGGLVIPAYVDKEDQKFPLLREWQKRGSGEVNQIEQWWDERPWARVGVLGGMDSFAVLDADTSSGTDILRSIFDATGWAGWDEALAYKTPGRSADGGGMHVMWRWDEGSLGRMGSAKIKGPGGRGELELRGCGTWSLVAGADRVSGPYELLNVPEKIGVIPAGFVTAFMAQAQVSVGGEGGGLSDLREVSPSEVRAWVEEHGRIGDGRKNILAGLAWYLAIRGADEDEYWSTLQWFAVDCCMPELEESVVRRKGEYTLERVARIKAKQHAETARFSSMMDRFV